MFSRAVHPCPGLPFLYDPSHRQLGPTLTTLVTSLRAPCPNTLTAEVAGGWGCAGGPGSLGRQDYLSQAQLLWVGGSEGPGGAPGTGPGWELQTEGVSVLFLPHLSTWLHTCLVVTS